jgi:hypothetical protein
MIATVTANLGSFDKNEYRNIDFVFHDENFPPRSDSMTPRLQARIVKMFMWQFVPDYDYYLWVDASCQLEPGGEEWFMKQLGYNDIAVFAHPHRDTVQEEADYLKERLELEGSGKKQKYILDRYENEDIDGQLEEVDPTAPLYASTAFIYRDSPRVRRAMKEWWHNTSRYHSIDQLSLPWAIRDLDVSVIEENYLKCEALTYVRNQ